jgi:outer membrane protein assembly factor BamB
MNFRPFCWSRWYSSPWLIVALFTTVGVAAENWPEFRGPTGDGHAAVPDLPIEWSEQTNVKWKTPIPGKGWSSPVVWNSQIWLTTAPVDGKQLFALGIDADSGRIQHNVKVFDNPFPQYCIDRNSYASSTPAIEAGRLYAHYGAHGTACIDTESGKVLWTRRDLPCFHHRGPASSVILFQNLLILTFDGFDLQYVAALDKQTGKTVWKRDRNIEYGTDNGDVKKAYGTPSVIHTGDGFQLVSPSAGAAIAYNPLTGDELWRVKAGGMNVSARPLFGNGLVYLGTADGGFVQYAVKPDGRGDVTNSHVVWKNSKGVPKAASQVLAGDLLFMANEQGVFTCVDAKTGETVWAKRVGGSFIASPLYAGGRIYFFNEQGETHVIAAEREYKLLATNKLDEGFMASPAVYQKSLILRTVKNLYCIE